MKNTTIELSTAVRNIIENKKNSSEFYSNKRFKKSLDTYVAELATDTNIAILSGRIATVMATSTKSLKMFDALGHTDVKPVVTGLSKHERTLAYVSYNNGKTVRSLQLLAFTCETILAELNTKSYKSLVRGVLMAYLRSFRTKTPGTFIMNTVLPVFSSSFNLGTDEIGILSSGQIQEILVEAEFITRNKTKTQGKHSTFMIGATFKNVEELFITMMETRKESIRFVAPKEVTANSFVVSQKSWAYTQAPLSPALVYTLNKLNQTKVSFADWVNIEHISEAITNKLTNDGANPFQEWMGIEIMFAVREYEAALNAGNEFYIEHFTDGVNRIYEYKSHFGFQEGSSIRCMLRFGNKKSLTQSGYNNYVAAAEEMYGTWEPAKILAMDPLDKWGYAAAIANPEEPTGSIIYKDGTSQGTGIYGAYMGCQGLLTLGGFTQLDESVWKKAYEVLADELNLELGLHYTAINCEVTLINIFNPANIKSINMTKLYNVGDERILSGKGFKAEDENSDENFDINYEDIIAEGEFIRCEKVDGKNLVPLLQTVRDAGLAISKEDLLSLFNKAIRRTSPFALRAMAMINAVVKTRSDLEIFEWASYDGTINKYAMATTINKTIVWTTSLGHAHQITHRMRALRPLVAERGVAPRFVQSDDSSLVRYVANVIDPEQDIAAIHDSIGSHGNDSDDITDGYVEGFVKIFTTDALTDKLNQISKDEIASVQARLSVEEKSGIVAQIRTGKYGFMLA